MYLSPYEVFHSDIQFELYSNFLGEQQPFLTK